MRIAAKQEDFPCPFEDPYSKVHQTTSKFEQPNNIKNFVYDLTEAIDAHGGYDEGYSTFELNLTTLRKNRHCKYSREAYYLEATTHAVMRPRGSYWVIVKSGWDAIANRYLDKEMKEDLAYYNTVTPPNEKLLKDIKDNARKNKRTNKKCIQRKN